MGILEEPVENYKNLLSYSYENSLKIFQNHLILIYKEFTFIKNFYNYYMI
jgi:hypothetical protein